MTPSRLYILDFDGTMADTRGIILATTHHTLRDMQLPDAADADIIATIGLPLTECFARILPPASQHLATACAERYHVLFEEHNRPGAVPLYPHVAETIRSLAAAGATISIASSRGRDSLRGFVREMGLEREISLIVSADDVAHAKPHPEPVLMTLQALGFRADEAVVVGDTPFDILMGRAAGTRTIGVDYGNATAAQLREAGADRVVSDFGEIAMQ